MRKDVIIFAFKQSNCTEAINDLSKTVLNTKDMLYLVKCEICKKKIKLIDSICRAMC